MFPVNLAALRGVLERNPELAIDQDDYNINVTYTGGEKLSAEALLSYYDNYGGGGRPAHLYFHVPLCNYICHFCNYVKKKASGTDVELDLWVTALITEAERYLARAAWLKSAKIESVYFGGGTASILRRRHLEKLLSFVRENFCIQHNCEISLEGNPDNFLNGEAADAADIGFNRFSLGVQSLQQAVNQFAGRKHDPDMSLRAISNLADTGCPYNVDMMFGLPLQTPDVVADDIETLLQLKVPTVTIYRFRNADREKMGIGNRSAWNSDAARARLRKEKAFRDLNTIYETRLSIVERFLAHGYAPSPCGWWSAPNTYTQGNIPQVSRNKWQKNHSMIAFGPGAYGWITGDLPEQYQTHNVSDIGQYLAIIQQTTERPIAFGRKMGKLAAAAAKLGFAFKARQPIYLKEYETRFGINLRKDPPFADVANLMSDRGFWVFDEPSEAYHVTLLGEFVHEEIISKYIHERITGEGVRVCNAC